MNRFSRGSAGSSLGAGPEPVRPLRARVPLAVAASSPPASLRASQSLRSQHGVCRPSARARSAGSGLRPLSPRAPVLGGRCRLELPLLGSPWSRSWCCGGEDPAPSVVRSCADTPSVHCRGRVVLHQLWVQEGPKGTCAQPGPWNLCVWPYWGRGSLQMCVHEESHGELSLGRLAPDLTAPSVSEAQEEDTLGRRPPDDGGRGSTGQGCPEPGEAGGTLP